MLQKLLSSLSPERGQVTSEYVVVTAIAVAISIAVVFVALGEELSNALASIGGAITNILP